MGGEGKGGGKGEEIVGGRLRARGEGRGWVATPVLFLFSLFLTKFNPTPPAPLREIIECLSYGGSMVTRLKLKGIDGRAHQEWSLRLNLTQHGKTHQVQTVEGLTD